MSDADGFPPRGVQLPLPDDLDEDLTEWWMARSQQEADRTIPKAIEYGGANRAADLVDIGRTMWLLIDPGEESGVEQDDGFYQELAIYFYLVGKMGRWTAALRQGRRVSDDTVFDIGVYSKMVQRIREAGGWPK